MTARQTLAALALALGLPLLGYLWPLPAADLPGDAEDRWTWPEPTAATRHSELPANLASYWPGKKPTNSTAADGQTADSQAEAARRDWTLIGIIRQGDSLSALVQDPQRNILTLQPGDSLDQQRRISDLEPTRLHWHDDEGQTGELPLYPVPIPNDQPSAE